MVSIKINGISRQFDGSPDMPLLWYVVSARKRLMD